MTSTSDKPQIELYMDIRIQKFIAPPNNAYAGINLTEKDIPRLIKFLNMLNEGDKESFRQLIMDFTILDTSYVFE